MTDQKDRRTFLRCASGAGIVTVVTPLFAGVSINHLTKSTAREEQSLDTILHYFVNPNRDIENPFVAHANPILVGAAILGGIAAIVQILDYFDIRPRWSRSVDYSAPGTSAPSFSANERSMRQRNYNSFSGVHRSPKHRKVSLMAGTNSSYSDRAAEGVIRHDQGRAVTLDTRRGNVLSAATQLVNQHRLQPEDAANNVAVTNAYATTVWDNRGGSNVPIDCLETASGGYIVHDQRPYGRYDGGLVGVHIPGVTQPCNIPMAGMYSA